MVPPEFHLSYHAFRDTLALCYLSLTWHPFVIDLPIGRKFSSVLSTCCQLNNKRNETSILHMPVCLSFQANSTQCEDGMSISVENMHIKQDINLGLPISTHPLATPLIVSAEDSYHTLVIYPHTISNCMISDVLANQPLTQ